MYVPTRESTYKSTLESMYVSIKETTYVSKQEQTNKPTQETTYGPTRESTREEQETSHPVGHIPWVATVSLSRAGDTRKRKRAHHW